MEKVVVKKLGSDQEFIVGISVVVCAKASDYEGAVIYNGEDDKLVAPMLFYSGDLNVVRTEMHKIIDDLMDQVG